MQQRQRNNNKQRGLTIVELLVVIAIMGIAAAIAIPAYQEYLASAHLAKVRTHYDEATRVVKYTFQNARTSISTGRSAAVPATEDDWIALINPGDTQAPGGGGAYIPSTTGDSLTGAIGIVATGDLASGDASVTITRPSFSDLGDSKISVITAAEVY